MHNLLVDHNGTERSHPAAPFISLLHSHKAVQRTQEPGDSPGNNNELQCLAGLPVSLLPPQHAICFVKIHAPTVGALEQAESPLAELLLGPQSRPRTRKLLVVVL